MSQANLHETREEARLDDAFTRRLALALPAADQRRRRRAVRHRLARLIPALLLVAPIAGWRLMLTSPDGVHASINALAWLTFVLDVGVHVDGTLLTFLDLQTLPSIVGGLLLVVIAAWVLSAPREKP